MRPPRPAPCRITAISGLSRRCSKAKWTRRANQWCRRPGVPLCQLRRNELGLGASRAPEGAGRARGCALSFQKCCGKPRSPPLDRGRGMWAVMGGRAGVRGSQANFSCCPHFGQPGFGELPEHPARGWWLPAAWFAFTALLRAQHPTKGSTEPGTSSHHPAGHGDRVKQSLLPYFIPSWGQPCWEGRAPSRHQAPSPSSKPQQRVLSRCQVPVRSQAPSPRPHDASRCRE